MQSGKQEKAYKKLMKAIKERKLNFGKLKFLGVPFNKMSKKDLMCALAYTISLNLQSGAITKDGQTKPVAKEK